MKAVWLLREEEDIRSFWELLDLSGWDEFFRTHSALLPPGAMTPSQFALAVAEGDGSGWDLGAQALNALRAGVKGSLQLFTVLLLGGCLLGLLSPGERGGVSRTGAVCMRLGLCALVMLLLLGSVTAARQALRDITTLYKITLTLSLSALTLLGSPGTAAALGAAGEVLLGTILGAMEKGMVPLIAAGGVLGTADAGEKGVFYGLSQLTEGVCRGGIRLVSLLYMAVSGLLNTGAATADALLLKTGRAAAGALPALGGLVSDSMEAVAGCLGALKSGLGTTAVLLLVLVILSPALSLLLQALAVKAASLFASSLGAGAMAPVCQSLHRMLTLLASLLIAAAAMGAVCIRSAMSMGGW